MNKDRFIAVDGRVLRVPISNSMLDSIEKMEYKESLEIRPEKDFIKYYNEQLNKVNSNREKILEYARRIYNQK